jgi:hypothetical protein
MKTNTKQLDAASVRDKILNAKGNFVKAAWKSNPSPAASFKKEGIILEKRTVAVVQAGVQYANLSAVKDAIAAGERSSEIGELPFGSWYVDPLTQKSWYPYVITHMPKGSDKEQFYLRLYPSNAGNHIPKSIYYVNGEIVDKVKFAEYLTPAEARKITDPKEEDKPLCFTIKLENLLDLPEDV